MRLFDLSLRYKLPLWGGGLILASALAVSASFVVQVWDNLNQDLLQNAQDIGRTMAPSLFPMLLHDNVWGAFEIVSLPFSAHPETALHESLIVIDSEKRVYVSSRPDEHPVLRELSQLGPEYQALSEELPLAADAGLFSRAAQTEQIIFVAVPIANDGVRLGTLIVTYNKSLLWQRFSKLVSRALWITLLMLAVLLPVTAYWGRRMMRPLQLVTDRISDIGSAQLQPLDPSLYPYQDEVGLLFLAYKKMLTELQDKAEFEKEMIKSERMAAVGRLTASIAHEINNPLGGMLNAISTLKRHGNPDPITQKTISLLERGLSQIRETVAALLVEAKVKSHPLSAADFEDVRILVGPAASKQGTQIASLIEIPDTLPLPSTLVRQLLINLLLNAIAAAGSKGRVAMRAQAGLTELAIVIENNGQTLSPEQLTRLFEPFTSFSEQGHGLGLWICYRIVTQLGGTIRVESGSALTRFTVHIPLDPLDDTSEPKNLPD